VQEQSPGLAQWYSVLSVNLTLLQWRCRLLIPHRESSISRLMNRELLRRRAPQQPRLQQGLRGERGDEFS